MKLYQWQKDCLENWKSNHYRGIVNVITGAGKTVVALAAIDLLLHQFPNLRIKVVVPTIPLANQWNQMLLKHAVCADEFPGFFGGGKRDADDRKFMIYIINSARLSLSKHIQKDFALKRPVLLICDECHHYQSRENRRIFDFLRTENSHLSLYHCMGLSATPFGTQDDAFLRSVLGEEIYSYGFQAASAEHIISGFYICQISVSFLKNEYQAYLQLTDQVRSALRRLLITYPHLEHLDKTAFMKAVSSIAHEANMDPEEPAVQFLLTTFQRKNASTMSQARLLCCISLIRSFPFNRRILIFCEQIEQAESIYRMINRTLGPVAGLYHSAIAADARKRILSQFKENSIRILCTCRCLDEGVDVPDADVGIVISSSSVARQRTQRLGRIIRRSPNKQNACLYYIYIRESSDETTYLDNMTEEDVFNLRYETAEDTFSNELYEFAALTFLRTLRTYGARSAIQNEIRSCILEGLTRPDSLMNPQVQKELLQRSKTQHEKNYWFIMNKIGEFFQNADARPGKNKQTE